MRNGKRRQPYFSSSSTSTHQQRSFTPSATRSALCGHDEDRARSRKKNLQWDAAQDTSVPPGHRRARPTFLVRSAAGDTCTISTAPPLGKAHACMDISYQTIAHATLRRPPTTGHIEHPSALAISDGIHGEAQVDLVRPSMTHVYDVHVRRILLPAAGPDLPFPRARARECAGPIGAAPAPSDLLDVPSGSAPLCFARRATGK